MKHDSKLPLSHSALHPASSFGAHSFACAACRVHRPSAKLKPSGHGFSIVGDYFLLFADEYKLGSPVTGLKAYERGCSLGNATACSLAAYEILRGKRVTREVPRALALFERACQGGSPSECDDLGRLYETGKSFGNTDGLSIDLEKALSYYKKACSRDANWCLDAAKVAGQLGKAEESYRLAVRSCGSRDSEACLLAAVAHETGKGAPKDADKAKALFTKACDNGEGEKDACKKIGVKM